MMLLVTVDEVKLGDELPIGNIAHGGGDMGRMAR